MGLRPTLSERHGEQRYLRTVRATTTNLYLVLRLGVRLPVCLGKPEGLVVGLGLDLPDPGRRLLILDSPPLHAPVTPCGGTCHPEWPRPLSCLSAPHARLPVSPVPT